MITFYEIIFSFVTLEVMTTCQEVHTHRMENGEKKQGGSSSKCLVWRVKRVLTAELNDGVGPAHGHS